MLAGATLGQVKTGIQVKGYGTDTATHQVEMINAVYRRVLASRRWSFLEVRTTLTTTVGSPTVTLTPADLLHVNSVRIELGSEFPEISYIPIEALRDYNQQNQDLSTPIYWSKTSGQLELSPRPDRVYNVKLEYTSHPAALAADADVLVIPRGYEDVIVWGAVADMAYRQRDWNAYNAAKREYADRLSEMVGQYGNEQTQNSREVVRWAGWNDVGLSY